MAKNPFRYFKTSPEIIQLAVLMYVWFPLSLRNVEDLLHARGIDVCHESVRLWVDRFGTYFAHKMALSKEAILRVYDSRLFPVARLRAVAATAAFA
jgi:putative transposase